MRKISIVGERCTGTNWIESLFTENFSLESAHTFGWKHAPSFGFMDNPLSTSQNTLFVFVVRNSLDWLRSFYNAPHHVKERKTSLEAFIEENPWISRDNGVIRTTDSLHMKPFADLLDMRHKKHAHWLEISTLSSAVSVINAVWVRYEDVLENPEKFLSNMQEKFELTLRRDTEPFNLLNKQYKKKTTVKVFDRSEHSADQFWNQGPEKFVEWFFAHGGSRSLLVRLLARLRSHEFEKQMDYDGFYQALVKHVDCEPEMAAFIATGQAEPEAKLSAFKETFSHTDAQSIVQRLYRECLSRDADSAAQTSYVPQLASGTYTEQQVRHILCESEEYKQRFQN